ncbi:hypothetical protein [Sulfurimonas sp.]|uniref:hypothetical protein n=1 Tax=Sulfurimonas sp. TaxID=2022749 RepID=UPI0035677C2C
MWLKKLQIAVIEKNTDAIESLLDTAPEFDNIKDVESAMYLLREAAELVYTLKDETALTIKQLKKNIDFLKSTQPATKNKLDIKL